MGDKRSRPYGNTHNNGYGNPHGQKKHKMNDGRSGFQKKNGNTNFHGFTNRTHVPPPHTAAELQAALLPLLDQLVHHEAKGSSDNDIMHHAQQLRTLLFDRSQAFLPSALRRQLDVKNPETEIPTAMPPYVEHVLLESKDLPPLPRITKPHLEEAVFTHVSAHEKQSPSPRGHSSGKPTYERLEFLGDAYIEVIASRLVYSRFPNLDPSHQSELREVLVKNETLSKYAKAYDLAARLKCHEDMRDAKGWAKITADVFEAYVAAIVLSDRDNGYSIAEEWLTELWAPTLLNYKVVVVENPLARDTVNRLIAAPGIKVEYRMEKNMEMIDGKQRFYMGVYLTGWGFTNQWLGSGEGQNKAQASTFAAADALEKSMDVLQKANAEKLKIYPPKKKEDNEGDAGRP